MSITGTKLDSGLRAAAADSGERAEAAAREVVHAEAPVEPEVFGRHGEID
jgi:hypothetical protein